MAASRECQLGGGEIIHELEDNSRGGTVVSFIRSATVSLVFLEVM